MHRRQEDEKPDEWSHRVFQADASPVGHESLSFPSTVVLTGIVGGVLVPCMEKITVEKPKLIADTWSRGKLLKHNVQLYCRV